MRSLPAVLLICLSLPCAAQVQAPAQAAPTAPAPVTRVERSPDTVPQRGGEPQVRRLVSEDDAVRIDELRVRGVTRKLTVQPKLAGVPAYEIGGNSDGRDATQDRRSDGRALWQLFAF
jgi:hypothetical protein